MELTSEIFDKLLDPLTKAFTPEMARIIADYRVDDATQCRVDELAQKSSDGKLTPLQESEYAAIVDAATVIAILKAKSRRLLDVS